MQTGARRVVSLIPVLLLFLLAALPPVGAGASEPDDAPSSLHFERQSDRLKHPRLDSQLMERIELADTLSARSTEGDTALIAITVLTSGSPAAVADAMSGHGALIANTGVEVVEAYAPVSALTSIAELPDVLTVREIEQPFPLATVSQGVAVHGAPSWTNSGFSGAGVKVGIIDVGFAGFSALIGSELPVPVTRCYRAVGLSSASLDDCERGGVHGTAVTETVVDVAPDATIYIANPWSHRDLHDTVAWMAAEGVTIINHSVGWGYEGPGDGTSPRTDGPLGAVDVAVDAGITWFNAAGNEALSSWSMGYLDEDGDTTLEFAPGVEANGISVQAGRELILYLRWEDSWANAATDLDLFLINSEGEVLRSSQSQQSGGTGHQPYERIRYRPSSTGMIFAAIIHHSGPAPGWIQTQAFTGETLQYSAASYSMANPAESDSPGLLAVGAAPWTSPHTIAPYSSQGPTRDGRIKPDLVGVDNASTVSYGSSGFSGTSQASPHVAGLAALVKQRFPTLTPAELASYLKANASQSGAPNNIWGHGLALLPALNPGDAPVPLITSINPASSPPGSGPVTITVRGAGFVLTSTVRFNGDDRSTVYVSATELRADLLAGDVYTAGSATITVFTPSPGGGLSNPLAYTIGASLDPAPDHAAFADTWSRTDLPVKMLLENRTWIWGDGAIAGPFWEAYAESPGQQRAVKYFDKSRMEVNDSTADPSADWYVTNGLLVIELISGRMQVGDDTFEQRDPAAVNVAGDPDDLQGPTYATFAPLLIVPAAADGELLTQRVSREGLITNDSSFASYEVTAAYRVTVPGIDHQIASPFWEFMNSTALIYEDGYYEYAPLFENPFYATGLPVTEAYWTTVKVAGTPLDVLIQCFERRCLTYTPDNPTGWQVEAGNVGRHYYIWRYGEEPTIP